MRVVSWVAALLWDGSNTRGASLKATLLEAWGGVEVGAVAVAEEAATSSASNRASQID